MKVCNYCSNTYPNDMANCANCGGAEYSSQCENCGTRFQSKYCPTCGKSAEETMKTCPNCHKKSFNLFCPYCGTHFAKQEPRYAPPPPPGPQYQQPTGNVYQNSTVYNAPYAPVYGKEKSKWVAFVLCLCLGVIGAHKFYEGKFLKGILYLFTGGLFGIGVIVDLIVILCKSDPYYV